MFLPELLSPNTSCHVSVRWFGLRDFTVSWRAGLQQQGLSESGAMGKIFKVAVRRGTKGRQETGQMASSEISKKLQLFVWYACGY